LDDAAHQPDADDDERASDDPHVADAQPVGAIGEPRDH
jgi:hypothetical protein